MSLWFCVAVLLIAQLYRKLTDIPWFVIILLYYLYYVDYICKLIFAVLLPLLSLFFYIHQSQTTCQWKQLCECLLAQNGQRSCTSWLQVEYVSRELHSQQPWLPDALLRGNHLLQGLLDAVEVLHLTCSFCQILSSLLYCKETCPLRLNLSVCRLQGDIFPGLSLHAL